MKHQESWGGGGWSYELLTLVAKRRTEMKEDQGWEVQRSTCEAVTAVTAEPVRLDGLSSGGEATSNHLSFLLLSLVWLLDTSLWCF